jgi:hypothetical protein
VASNEILKILAPEKKYALMSNKLRILCNEKVIKLCLPLVVGVAIEARTIRWMGTSAAMEETGNT